ncbi:TrbG/VirB9 family P-type conjugative transfer protein [Helicobacter cynogastricus]|uniref:TrbG/VirB9 family P-type conjugative transfer protein n=1 Tax=Helicobacter cynogastricus TaxID=329937 RepID=UPI000CF0FD5D|nr:TrbG/VirB9 family P-type conjugative transfer protein [Helicobacter cynogastricus]
MPKLVYEFLLQCRFKAPLFFLALFMGFSVLKAISDPPVITPPPTHTEESDEEEMQEEDEPSHSMQDLHAIQESFFYKQRTDLDNTLFIDAHLGETYKIRLRYAMVSMFIFNEPIAEVILGDSIGFSSKMLRETQQNSNVLLLKPLQIGIDSNLNVIGKSGKVYAFYIFSTTYTSNKNPALNIYVSDRHFFEHHLDTSGSLALLNSEQAPYQPATDNKRYLIIGQGVNAMRIDRSQIQRNYKVLGAKKRAWFCLWLCKVARKQPIKPLEIFNDTHFTYFKFNHLLSQIKFPVAYKVVDGYDNPINTRVVGDYLVAEDIADKWTLREGKLHACIRRTRQSAQ